MEQIRFFRKNQIDLSKENVVMTVTDAIALNNGQDFIDYVRNRKNTSAWATTGSTDAANTTIDVDLDGSTFIDSLFLIKHNFKAFTIQYWGGLNWVDFPTPISETNNSEETSFYKFDGVQVAKLRLVITETFVVDDDKILRQFVVTSQMGQLEGWPIIKNPTISTNKIKNKMLSGKLNVIETIESFSTQLQVKVLRSTHDLDLIEAIYLLREGVLLWLNGGDDTQFSSVRLGYRKQDLPLVRPTDDYSPEFYKGLYRSGIKFKMKLEESIQ